MLFQLITVVTVFVFVQVGHYFVVIYCIFRLYTPGMEFNLDRNVMVPAETIKIAHGLSYFTSNCTHEVWELLYVIANNKLIVLS